MQASSKDRSGRHISLDLAGGGYQVTAHREQKDSQFGPKSNPYTLTCSHVRVILWRPATENQH